MTRGGAKWLPVVDEERCTGCAACVEVCGPRCLEILDGVAVLSRPHACGSEDHCIEPCLEGAIQMRWVPLSGDVALGRWKMTEP